MYKILKTDLSGMCYWVNDSEGIPIEFDTQEEAQRIAYLFQASSKYNSKNGYKFKIV